MQIRPLLITIALLLGVMLLSCNTKSDKGFQSVAVGNSEDTIDLSIPKKPIMGWASWNNYRVNINEEIIRSQADAMVSTGLKDAGYSYVNIDDGFYGGRDENGNLLVHKERFPSGMKTLAEYIHAKGLKEASIPMLESIPVRLIGTRTLLVPGWAFMGMTERTWAYF